MDFQVSVIIPVYNAERFLNKAAESALLFPEVKEVILIEDGSPDNAIEICKSLENEHPRVKLYQHPDKGNHGAGASRNLGFMKASCPYIAFLDADDYYLPNRFDVDKIVFEQKPEAGGVYNAIGSYFYSQSAKKDFDSAFQNHITTVEELVEPEMLFPSFIQLTKGFGYFSLDGLTIKKTILSKLEPWFNIDLRLHQDTEFIFRLTYYFNLYPGEINKPVAIRGVHNNNRITNIHFDKKKKHLNQKKLWVAVFDWAKKEKIPENYFKHIRRMKVCKSIQSNSYLMAWPIFLINVLKDRDIIIKAIYYNPLHYYFFGRNKISIFLLGVKIKIQKELGISWEIK